MGRTRESLPARREHLDVNGHRGSLGVDTSTRTGSRSLYLTSSAQNSPNASM